MGLRSADFHSPNDLADFINNSLKVTLAPVDVGNEGAGYAVDDLLTVLGGEGSDSAVLKVTSAPAGAIATVSIYSEGGYMVAPANPVSVSGSGGAKFNLTTAAAVAGQASIVRILSKDARWYVEYWT